MTDELDEQLEEMKINSTESQLEDFLESVIWGDLKREVQAWMKGFEVEMQGLVGTIARENPSTANVLTHLGNIDGRIQAAKYFLVLPNVLLDAVRMDKEEKQEREEE